MGGGGGHFTKGWLFEAAWVFNGTTASFRVCADVVFERPKRNSASENYFHGVATFTVSCCLFLENPHHWMKGLTF